MLNGPCRAPAQGCVHGRVGVCVSEDHGETAERHGGPPLLWEGGAEDGKQVGLHRVRVVPEQSEEAYDSPADFPPTASMTARISAPASLARVRLPSANRFI